MIADQLIIIIVLHFLRERKRVNVCICFVRTAGIQSVPSLFLQGIRPHMFVFFRWKEFLQKDIFEKILF